jgi:hypothetical protein
MTDESYPSIRQGSGHHELQENFWFRFPQPNEHEFLWHAADTKALVNGTAVAILGGILIQPEPLEKHFRGGIGGWPILG